MKATDICTRAADLLSGDRARTHGDLAENHAAIALYWNAYLRNGRKLRDEIGAQDVALMMALVKMSRTQRGAFNADDFVDGAAYFAIAGEVSGTLDSWADSPSSHEP